MNRRQPRNAISRFLQAGVGRRVSGDDELRGLLVDPRVLLYEARDADAFFRENLTEGGQHSGAVIDADPVISARLYLTHRNHADAVVEAERRPALNAAADRARQVDEVADDGGGGGPPARSLADEKNLPHQVTLDEDRIVGALDLGQRVVERDHRGVHARLDPSRVALRMRDELDRVAKLARIAKVDRLDRFDPFAKDVVRADLDLVRDRPKDGELVRSVKSADTAGGIGLGKPGRP